LHYYTFNIGDYASHTRGLSLLEDLAYRRLLDSYYLAQQPLNGSVATIARMIGMRGHEAEVEYVLQSFFVESNGRWSNDRADSEIKHFVAKSEKAAMSARLSVERRTSERSANAERTLSERSANAQRTLNERSTVVELTNNQEPITNNQEPGTKNIKTRRGAVLCPPGVDESIWNDFIAVRHAKRSPMTATALKAIEAESTKAGWSLQDALKECISRGWQGFKADWVKGNGKSEASLYERNMAALTWRPEEVVDGVEVGK
jgi:uncharacterized protein YdaU (DUF1376 family)